ncbi:MAG: hypothetical protein M1814_004262 [Vezdaea aestivalis]|nr:MAG: hypothetical protein M1814_004262 [Vezdaea aestivalis]
MAASEDGSRATSYDEANALVRHFLLEKSQIYAELQVLREKGWADPRGDQYFAAQRRRADTADSKMAWIFFKMMQGIAREMNSATGALDIQESHDGSQAILDFCTAPGGYLDTAMDLNPKAQARAFSLPVQQGGHKILMPRRWGVTIDFLDITMLAEDMGHTVIPSDHPDFENFQPRRLPKASKFDLIICDGQVLREHKRAKYRENHEALRLTSVQLALGLEHIKAGGTMVILLHRLEAWNNLATMFRFSKFSTVKTFKPQYSHSKRSSFYFVAKNVQSDHEEALHAMEIWKSTWRTATFGDNQDLKSIHTADLEAKEVIQQFGQDLIKLGNPIWSIQARALAQASFITDA